MVLPGLTKRVPCRIFANDDMMVIRQKYRYRPNLSFKQFMSRRSCNMTFAVILLLIPSNAYADIIICKLGDYFENRFSYSYVLVDDVKMFAKLGIGETWGETAHASKKSIAIGEKIYWTYFGYDNSYKRTARFEFSLRIRKGGEIDLLDFSVNGRNSKIKNDLQCKRSQ